MPRPPGSSVAQPLATDASLPGALQCRSAHGPLLTLSVLVAPQPMGCSVSVQVQSELWDAIVVSDVTACKAALVAGASPDARNAQGETALHLGIKHFKSEVLRLLLESTADLEARDAHGQVSVAFRVPAAQMEPCALPAPLCQRHAVSLHSIDRLALARHCHLSSSVVHSSRSCIFHRN